MSAPEPLYSAKTANAAYHLHYSWTGWPSGGAFDRLPSPELLNDIKPLWESDGLRVLERYWSDEYVQLTFSAKPEVTPVFICQRAKGRLQHAFRQANRPQEFSRKLSLRSVGDNRSSDVLEYIARQVEKERFADPSFAAKMREQTMVFPEIHLATPSMSARGAYWYNLHLVLVTQRRDRIHDTEILALFRETCSKIATKKGHQIAALSIMPDHLHLALRGNIEHSPTEIALAFQNNLAFALGQKPIWQESFYAGTFSEYDMAAIRRNRSPQ